MKNLFLLGLIFTFTSCSQSSDSKTPKSKVVEIQNFDWLLGKWKRLDDPKGKQTFENWAKKSPKEYIGLGFSLSEKDTVFKENMRLIQLEGIWNLEVVGVNPGATLFKFTDQSDLSFVCENEKNEFPKKIEYTFKNNQLEAKVSAGETVIPFTFEKVE